MKYVVITGSSRVIGLGLAKSFLELGCSVTISGRVEEVLLKAIDDLGKSYDNNRILGIVCDVGAGEEKKDIHVVLLQHVKNLHASLLLE